MSLIIPVETVARELDAKLLLALHTCAQGLPVIVGNKALINLRLDQFEPGIYLSHNFDKGRARILSIARGLGHAVVAWDEEGLVWTSAEFYRKRRVSEKSLAQLDRIYAWGTAHAAALEPLTAPIGLSVEPTGNPRTDLARPQFTPIYGGAADALKQRYGRFILINSNFGWINHALAGGNDGASDEERVRVIADKSGHAPAYIRFRLNVFQAFADLLPALAGRFQDRTIIVRPHPSESAEGWQKAAAGLGNVHVIYDDDLISWLSAAGAVVHNGCTTAVETAALGKTPIMYRPVDGGVFDSEQPLGVSRTADTPAALFDAIDEVFSGAPMPEDVRAYRDSLVGPDDELASARISRSLVALNRSKSPAPRQISAMLRARFRRMEKAVVGLDPRSPVNPAYYGKKFAAMPPEEIERRLADLARCSGLGVPGVTELSDRIFALSPR